MTKSISESQTAAIANPLDQIVDPERYRQFIDKCSRCYSDSTIWEELFKTALEERVPDQGTLNASMDSQGVKARWIVALVATQNARVRRQYVDALPNDSVESLVDFEALCNELELDDSLLAFGGASEFDESHDCLLLGKELMRYVDGLLDGGFRLDQSNESIVNDESLAGSTLNPKPDAIKVSADRLRDECIAKENEFGTPKGMDCIVGQSDGKDIARPSREINPPTEIEAVAIEQSLGGQSLHLWKLLLEHFATWTEYKDISADTYMFRADDPQDGTIKKAVDRLNKKLKDSPFLLETNTFRVRLTRLSDNI